MQGTPKRVRRSFVMPVAATLSALLIAGCSGGSGSGGSALVPASNGSAGVTTASTSHSVQLKSVSASAAFAPSTQIGWAHFGIPNGGSASTLITPGGFPLHGASIQTDSCANIDGNVASDGAVQCVPTDLEIENLPMYGLNAIHIYAEDQVEETVPNPVGVMTSYIDHIVDVAAKNGIYVIITPASSNKPVSFDAQFVHDFWTVYASRYAQAQNVIFEVANEPQDSRVGGTKSDQNNPKVYNPATIAMEADAYTTIRRYAPSTPILFFSYPYMFSQSTFNSDLTALKAQLNAPTLPRNTGIAFHGYGPLNLVNAATYAIQGEGIPLVDTEFHNGLAAQGSITQNVDLTNDHDIHSVSWLTFVSIKSARYQPQFSIQIPDNYENLLRAANVSWPTAYCNLPYPYVVANFSFFQPEIQSGDYQYDPAAASWTASNSGATLGWSFTGASGISGDSSPFTSGNPALPSGIHNAAFIQNQGAMWQTFRDLSPNHAYTLGFWQAARNYWGVDGNPVVVSIDGQQIGSFTPSSITYAPQFFSFTTNGNSAHTLTFNGQNAQGDKTTFIASVSIGG